MVHCTYNMLYVKQYAHLHSCKYTTNFWSQIATWQCHWCTFTHALLIIYYCDSSHHQIRQWWSALGSHECFNFCRWSPSPMPIPPATLDSWLLHHYYDWRGISCLYITVEWSADNYYLTTCNWTWWRRPLPWISSGAIDAHTIYEYLHYIFVNNRSF